MTEFSCRIILGLKLLKRGGETSRQQVTERGGCWVGEEVLKEIREKTEKKRKGINRMMKKVNINKLTRKAKDGGIFS